MRKRVNEIEAEQAELNKQIPKEDEQEAAPPASETLKSWIQENSYWCNTDSPENV